MRALAIMVIVAGVLIATVPFLLWVLHAASQIMGSPIWEGPRLKEVTDGAMGLLVVGTCVVFAGCGLYMVDEARR